MLAILLVLGLVATGTFAWFQAPETSTGNAFTAGILDLKIRAQPGPWQDGVSTTWTMTDMAPGDETSGQVELHIDSASIPADHLEITGDYTVSAGSADGMAKVMIITLMHYYKGAQQVDLLTDDGYDKGYDVSPGETGPKVEDVDGDGKLSLYDLKYSQSGNGVDDLLPPYGVWHFEMKIKFDEDAGNQFQGKTLDLTMMFTLNQHVSQ